MKPCENVRELLVGFIDQELEPDEVREVNEHLVRCAGCRKEYEQLRETAGKIETISFHEPQDKVLEALWNRPYSRFTRNAGMILVLAGWLALALFGVYEFLGDDKEPFIPKVASAALFIGFVVLLASVIRERLRTYKSDPYKEVER